MNNILMLVPMKPNLHPALKARCRENCDRIRKLSHHLVEVVIDESGPGDGHVKTLEERVTHTSAIKNAMIAKYLNRARCSHVFWMDSDIWYISPMIIDNLLQRSEGHEILAPCVMGWFPIRLPNTLAKCGSWYDTAGFVTMKGKNLNFLSPHGYENQLDSTGRVEMDGVGCVYLVPAEVYLAGAKHENVPGFTDHLAICRFARRIGVKSYLVPDEFVFHAYLPDFGEALHKP